MAGERGACPEAACSHHSPERAVRHDVVSCRAGATNMAKGGATRVRGSEPAMVPKILQPVGLRGGSLASPSRYGGAWQGEAQLGSSVPYRGATRQEA